MKKLLYIIVGICICKFFENLATWDENLIGSSVIGMFMIVGAVVTTEIVLKKRKKLQKN